MPTELPPFDPRRRSRRPAPSDEALFSIAASVIPSILVVLIALLPGLLVLPIFAAIAGTASMTIAVGARMRLRVMPVSSDGVRDLPRVLALIGLGAVMITDFPEVMNTIAGSR